jgi:hypothetical protein
VSEKAIAEYFLSLDAALEAYMCGDESKLAAHIAKHSWSGFGDLTYLRPAVLKAVTARETLPTEMRRRAKDELKRMGMRAMDDGDISD